LLSLNPCSSHCQGQTHPALLLAARTNMTEFNEICRQMFKRDHSVERVAHLSPIEVIQGDKKLFRVLEVSSPTYTLNLSKLERKMHVEVLYDGELYFMCKKGKWLHVTPCPPTKHALVIALIDKSRQYDRMDKKITKHTSE
jgi:hypothetical protein